MPSLPFQGDRAVDARAARVPPPPTQGGGSGLSYHVFRGVMTRHYLASWGSEAEETGHSERGEGGRGGKEEKKRREEKRMSGGGCGG